MPPPTLTDTLPKRYRRLPWQRIGPWPSCHKIYLDDDQLRPTILGAASDFPHEKDQRLPVVLGGESFVALAEGLQNALWALGGAPAANVEPAPERCVGQSG